MMYNTEAVGALQDVVDELKRGDMRLLDINSNTSYPYITFQPLGELPRKVKSGPRVVEVVLRMEYKE